MSEEIIDLNQPNPVRTQPPTQAPVVKSVESQQIQATTADDLIDELLKVKEDDFLPWETVNLPSQGVYYNNKLPGGIVQVRPMGIHADKILATARLAQTGQSIDYLLANCVRLTEGMTPDDLLAGDRIFLLYYLRGITHGNRYEFVLKCPNCEVSSTQVYDLNELAATTQGPNLAIGPEPFKVILPYMSEFLKRETWVKVRLVRGRDIMTMLNRQKFNKRLNASNPGARQQQQRAGVKIDQTITDNLALVIESFGSVGAVETHDQNKLRQLIDSNKLHGNDTATIREFLRVNSPGIDTTIEVQCPECNAGYSTELPITESFFRPTGNRKPAGT